MPISKSESARVSRYWTTRRKGAAADGQGVLGYSLHICSCFSILAKFFTVLAWFAPMNAANPHYMLFSTSGGLSEPGRWRFMLRAEDGSGRLSADDVEPDVQGERLELLAVVRGLEALDQPSRVTLVTPSQYVRSGIRLGLAEWRRNGWRWERFGQMVPVKDCDLWQRVDRALRFHEVECRRLRRDPAHDVFPVRPSWKAPAAAVGEPCARREKAGPRNSPAALSVLEPRSGKSGGPTGRRDVRRRADQRWRLDLGLGRLFRLVKLFTGNRPGSFSHAAVCKEV